MERNRLNRWAFGALAALALGGTACSSGAKVLSEDNFLAEMNAVCRNADRAIAKIDSADPAYVSKAVDIMNSSFDELSKLAPPKTLKADFDDFTAKLDDQITQAVKLQKAIKAKDEAASKTISDKLDTLTKDSDKLADSLGADKCVGVGGDGSTSDTTAGTTADTSTANTPLPILTTPIQTAPLNTSNASGGTTANSLNGVLRAPAGYTWEATNPFDAKDLFNDPVLGPALKSYGYGRLKLTVDGTLAEVYVIEMNGSWTPEQTAAYLAYEGVSDGVDITTPRGLPARQKVLAFPGADAVALSAGTIGVSIVTKTGIDGASILDAVVYEQG